MVAMPYVHDARHATRVLDLVRNGTTPGHATVKHLEANGFPEPAATQVWTFLSGLGLLESDGSPTARWIEYRDADAADEALGAIVKDVYAPLVERAGDGPATDADLQETVQRHDSLDPDTALLVVCTFRALCERAGLVLGAAPAAVRPRREVLHDVSDLLQRSVNEFEQARQCLAVDLTRPAHVAAWNSFVALAFVHLADDDFACLRSTGRRASWTLEELMRAIHGAELIRLLVKNDLVTSEDQSALEELLRQRNECAHPMPFSPDRAETAAYLSAVLAASAQLTGPGNR